MTSTRCLVRGPNRLEQDVDAHMLALLQRAYDIPNRQYRHEDVPMSSCAQIQPSEKP